MKAVLRHPLAARAGRAGLEALFATARYEVRGESNYREEWRAGRPVVFVLWHGRLLPLAYLHRGQEIMALVSRSRDGEQIAGLMSAWGFRVIRGSTSRGGDTALREIARGLRGGASLAITPDGPRGPRQTMKPGALIAARLGRAAVIPVAAGADRAWWPGDWDRFMIPQPFARVHVRYGAPETIPEKAGAATIAERAAYLESTLNRLVEEVDAGAGVA